ncbi:ATP-binding cassette domain-containing protein [Rickettsia sp. Oklahoma-10]|uniref:ATP-binding cassette domain-containing protein n=1 Tax=Rickettsia oklahomensis TaxID=3141789 RepID=A0AAU7BZS0_9RICK
MIGSGKILADSGSSGAGKSTISCLFYGFYNISSGSIAIGEKYIVEVTQPSLCKCIGIIPQDKYCLTIQYIKISHTVIMQQALIKL